MTRNLLDVQNQKTQVRGRKLGTFCRHKHELKKEKCPAWGKTCNACKGRNHFKKMFKKVHSVNTEENDNHSDNEMISRLAAVNIQRKSCVCPKMGVNNCEINFQLIVADINTICKKYIKKNQVKKTYIHLRMWNMSSMKLLGTTEMK